MKSNLKNYFCLFALVLVFASCATFKKPPVYPNMMFDSDPVSIGVVNASTDQFMGFKFSKVEIEVIFDPRRNEVTLFYTHGLGDSWQIWPAMGRKLFAEALGKYKQDFANQALINKYHRTRSLYGRFKGRYQWKTFKYSATYKASPYYELGYRFRENAPYFTISQRPAKEESTTNRSVNESPSVIVYFTRAQGDELAKLLDDEYIKELFNSLGASTPGQKDSDKDAYNVMDEYSEDEHSDKDENNEEEYNNEEEHGEEEHSEDEDSEDEDSEDEDSEDEDSEDEDSEDEDSEE